MFGWQIQAVNIMPVCRWKMGEPCSAPDGRNGSSIWDDRHVMDGFSRVNAFRLRTTLRRGLFTNLHFCVDVMQRKKCKRHLWLFMPVPKNVQAQCMMEIKGVPPKIEIGSTRIGYHTQSNCSCYRRKGWHIIGLFFSRPHNTEVNNSIIMCIVPVCSKK